jgi:cobyrinic acid a,c-diamide synthase
MRKLMLPRLMLAGSGGDCGKTLTAIGLAAAWREKGIRIAPFKKGPDYIDAAWLTLAAGVPARNLDTWMMDPSVVLRSFTQHAVEDGINLIEGNRGFHDGEGASGAHSSAELANLLKTPVVLIIPAVKATRTVAAVALGLKMMDPQTEIAGVILNRIANARQEEAIRKSMEDCTGLPVIGAIPRIDEELLPARHLGLVTPEEHLQSRKMVSSAAKIIAQSVDLDRIKQMAESAAPMETQNDFPARNQPSASGLRIGYFKCPAFTFYYPENLEALESGGARLVPVDPMNDPVLPDLDALYIGGGFPETHATSLSGNSGFLASIAQKVENSLPIWAECGGLIFLCRSVFWNGVQYPMSGVFQADIALGKRPAGHGYEEVIVDRTNPFVSKGAVLRGHEFHYSRIENAESLQTVFAVTRGTGLGSGRDGLIYKNTMACYLHVHAMGTAEWATGLLTAANNYQLLIRGTTRTNDDIA